MKIIYKKTIVEKLDDEIAAAEREGKKIERIILNSYEWQELHAYLHRKYLFPPEGVMHRFCGIPISRCDEDRGGGTNR